jgi:hypothetical protein
MKPRFADVGGVAFCPRVVRGQQASLRQVPMYFHPWLT